MRNNISNSSEHTLGISRSKSPMDDPLSLLYNMNDCYTMLKELVPSLPQNGNVSKIEILQHVIDYILDLQIALDSSSSLSSCQHQQQRLGQGQAASPRNPLATINSDISLITFQVKIESNRLIFPIRGLLFWSGSEKEIDGTIVGYTDSSVFSWNSYI